jgi:hypothetical protein
MVHLVIWEAPAAGEPEINWLDHVTDAEYGQPPTE